MNASKNTSRLQRHGMTEQAAFPGKVEYVSQLQHIFMMHHTEPPRLKGSGGFMDKEGMNGKSAFTGAGHHNINNLFVCLGHADFSKAADITDGILDTIGDNAVTAEELSALTVHFHAK